MTTFLTYAQGQKLERAHPGLAQHAGEPKRNRSRRKHAQRRAVPDKSRSTVVLTNFEPSSYLSLSSPSGVSLIRVLAYFCEARKRNATHPPRCHCRQRLDFPTSDRPLRSTQKMPSRPIPTSCISETQTIDTDTIAALRVRGRAIISHALNMWNPRRAQQMLELEEREGTEGTVTRVHVRRGGDSDGCETTLCVSSRTWLARCATKPMFASLPVQGSVWPELESKF